MRRKTEAEYLKAAVFGAHDGIITTFAVVAGVAGAQLSPNIVLVMGVANLIADGLSMALGDFLGEQSEQEFLHKKDKASFLWISGVITFCSFAVAGALPLVPYFVAWLSDDLSSLIDEFFFSAVCAAFALFTVGLLKSMFTKQSWWRSGLEVLGIGTIAALAAYGIGRLMEFLVNTVR